MTTAQVVETSLTVNNNSAIQDHVHPEDLESTKIQNLHPQARLTSIPAAFIWEYPPPLGVTCLHLSTISVISVKRLVVAMLPTMKQQRLQSRLTNLNIVG